MAACGGGGERRPRRGPAPIASFDHDVSDESSPETKQTFRLAEIREDAGSSLAPPEQRPRSHSSPAVGLQAPPAPRIDISRASSSSHHDSRDSSPEMALFAGAGSGEDTRAKLELGFREDGALDLRSSTEELAFLENAPGSGETRAPVTAPPSRRHSRKDSQGSETALLAVSGRTSRLSSVGSQCSAHSALSGFSHTSRVSRLSVVSGLSRSPSPHKMLLETSFCGPKPIETDPEVCAAAVEERLLEIAKLSAEAVAPAPFVDARDRREVRTEATVESSSCRGAPSLSARLSSPVALAPAPVAIPSIAVTTASTTETSTAVKRLHSPSAVPADEEKRIKETRNRARAEERRARSKERCDPSEAEVYQTTNRARDIIRIRLKPDHEYDDDDDEYPPPGAEMARKPGSLQLGEDAGAGTKAAPRRADSRTPSPSGAAVSRKSSFCSLFKSKETIASPDSPSDALKRKQSLNEGRSRSKSRDRSVTPTSAGKIKGSVLSLFKTPRKSTTSPSASSRDCSPVVQAQRQFPQVPPEHQRSERLKYYEESTEGIIHIPLRTPPDELDAATEKLSSQTREATHASSGPQARTGAAAAFSAATSSAKPTRRTVLPDGSIIIPLHSPTEKTSKASIATASSTTDHSDSLVGEDQSLSEATVRNDTLAASERKIYVEKACPSAKAAKVKRRERLTFTTHVGSQEQVFSTQFSLTKTPSITSEVSGSIPSFPESEDVRTMQAEVEQAAVTHKAEEHELNGRGAREHDAVDEMEPLGYALDDITGSRAGTPQDAGRDSSESEAGSDVVARGGSDVERRGLVIQESFEELPYVPTTLPQERSVAVPIVPVRERGGVSVASVRRPRATHPAAAAPRPVQAPPPPPPTDRIHIRLPRRARACSASAPPPPPPERARTRSGSEVGAGARKGEWVDFSEVPERRKQPKRIQTLPAAGAREPLSYAPPERCRCECHAHAPPAHAQLFAHESARTEGEREDAEQLLQAQEAPFTTDLDLHNHDDIVQPH